MTMTKPKPEVKGRSASPPKVKSRTRVSDRHAMVVRTFVIIAIVLLWYLISAAGVVAPHFLPGPQHVFGAMVEMVGDSEVRHHVGVSAQTILTAFALAALLGIAIGSLLGTVPILRAAYFDPIVVLMSTPKVVFLPVFLLIFGLGQNSALAFATFEAVVYVIVNVVGGMLLANERLLRMGAAFGATGLQSFAFVRLPAALPGVFAGLWFGIKHAFTGVLLAEMFISSEGIGGLVRQYTEFSQADRAFALIITVAAFMVVLGTVANRVEARLTRWRTVQAA